MAVGASVARSAAAGVARGPRPSLLPWLLPVALLVLWQLSLTFGVFKPHQLPPPLTVLETTLNQLRGQLDIRIVRIEADAEVFRSREWRWTFGMSLPF